RTPSPAGLSGGGRRRGGWSRLTSLRTASPAGRAGGGRWLLRRQGDADDLLVVADEGALTRVGRVRPHHRAPPAEPAPARELARRLDDVGAADLLVALGAELRNNQVALLVEQEPPVPLRRQEGIAPAHLPLLFGPGRGEVLPDPLAGRQLQAAQLTVAA